MRVMAPQGGGSSSVLAKVGAPGAAVYTASKHAVEGLTKAAALEGAASGVRVNAVAPGPVETEMLNRFTGGGRRGVAEDGTMFLWMPIVILAALAPTMVARNEVTDTSG